MVNLAQKWAEVYMQKNPNVSIQVTGGGSGTGVASLLNGTTDLANSSRELIDSELETARQKGVTPVVYEVALDGIALIVHPENKIDNLTIKQVSDVFSGKITNWKQVDGQDKPIALVFLSLAIVFIGFKLLHFHSGRPSMPDRDLVE